MHTETGFVETEGFPQSSLPRPLRRFVIGPEKIAEHVVTSVERGRGETTVPRYYAIGGVLQALFPNVLARVLGRSTLRR